MTVLTSTAYFPDSFDRQSRQEFELDGVRVVALPVAYAHMMGFGRRVRAFLEFYLGGMQEAKRLSKPVLIYASSTPPTVGEMGRRLSREWGIPYVFETVDVWPDVPIGMGIIRSTLLAGWLNRRVNLIYAEAAHIIALSDGMRDQILSHGVDPAKITVSYNGTNLKAFPFSPRTHQDGLHVIYTGTVGIANGVSVLCDLSLELTKRGVSGVRFTVLGRGNDLDAVKAYVRALGVTNVRFLDQVPKSEVAGMLASADVGIVTFAPFPVLEANSANKFYDYLASGLPVLINYQGWQAHYLKAHHCGLSSKMGDLSGLADNVEWLLRNPESITEMGLNGRKLAEECFDREKIAAELLQVFERTVR